MSYPSQFVVSFRSGILSVPLVVLQELFRRCPPDTEEGRKIFWARTTPPNESTHFFFGPYVITASGEYVGNLNTLEIFALKSYNQTALRTSPHFQEVLKEYGVEFEVAEVPYGCTFHVEDVPLEGNERVVVDVPWKAVIEDLYLMRMGGGKLGGWNPLTEAMLEDKKLALKILAK